MGLNAWLVDKSALTRLRLSPDAQEWLARIDRGLVRITAASLLEIGFSARSASDVHLLRQRPPVANMPVEYLTPAAEDRAVEVQSSLADRGMHRAPSVPDLLIAATAELSDLTVLHVDKDYELIAEITGQTVERLRIT